MKVDKDLCVDANLVKTELLYHLKAQAGERNFVFSMCDDNCCQRAF